jgi:hypothetical protein
VEVLDRYTDNELRQICNGIGPEFFPEKFRKIITGIFKYLEATAFLHDAEYQAQVGFSLANTHFYNNGMKEVDAKFAWYDPRRYVGRHRVRQFTLALQLFGIRAYYNAKNQTIAKEENDRSPDQ